MRTFFLIALSACMTFTWARGEETEGHWEDRGFIQTSDAGAAVFRITLDCTHLAKPFVKQVLHFKKNWQFVQPAKAGWGRTFSAGWGTSIRACGFETWKSISFRGTSNDKGMKIHFWVRAGKMGSSVEDITTKRDFDIPWNAFPFTEQDGDFTYDITFAWNTPERDKAQQK